MKHAKATLLLAHAAGLWAAVTGTEQLQQYNVDLQHISVSGLSAGAFMAVQYHMIHSSKIRGVGVIAGGPFFCAQDDVALALTSYPPPDPVYLAGLAKTAAVYDNIDAPENLRYSNYWFLSGTKDTVVHSSVVQTLPSFYSALGVDDSRISTVFDLEAEHCFPTNQTAYGEECTQLGKPYIGKCKFAAAHAMMEHLEGPLAPPVAQHSTNLIEFDQSQFGSGNSLNSIGYIYVPSACAGGRSKCKLHVTYTGLNEVAEANNIIVLYPQVSKSTALPENPEGCFDWWGYTDPLYAYAGGAQPRFIDALVSKVTGVNF